MIDLRLKLASMLLCALLLTGTADAWWFKKKKASETDPVQTYQPPAPDALERECGKLRGQVENLSRKPKYVQIMAAPRLDYLIRKYNRCKKDIVTQEFEYLRHVDIQKGPSLPAIRPAEEEIIGPEKPGESP